VDCLENSPAAAFLPVPILKKELTQAVSYRLLAILGPVKHHAGNHGELTDFGLQGEVIFHRNGTNT